MTYVSCGVEKKYKSHFYFHMIRISTVHTVDRSRVELGYLGLLCYHSYHNTFKYANKPVNRDLVVAILKGVRQSFC